MEDYKLFESLWKSHWFTRDIPLKLYNINNQFISDIYGVRGFHTPDDIYFLWNLGLNLPKDGKYLEIGSWVGLSATAVAFGLLSNSNFYAKIFCIDPWELMPEQSEYSDEFNGQDLFKIFSDNIERLKISRFVTTLKGKSVDIAQEITETDFDVIFIDGEHTYESSYLDIITWLPKLKKGGKICGHDAIPEGGVIKALERIKSEKNLGYSIIEPPYSHYIWELHVLND